MRPKKLEYVGRRGVSGKLEGGIEPEQGEEGIHPEGRGDDLVRVVRT